MEVQPVIDFKKSRKTVIEMLLDRKYKIIQPVQTDKYIEEDTKKLYTIMNFEDSLIIGQNEEKEDIHVYFIFSKIGIKVATSIIDKIIKNDIKHTILICRGGFTTFAEQSIKTSSKKHGVDIETFLQDKLLYNIMKNETQPQSIEHIKDKNRIKLLHQTLSIKKKQNLLIQSVDPVNKYYHGKPGEMYKVMTRGGKLDYYNIV
jgi:DNA-directed RNA polymerase subunit H (RpoH/RPB5)